MSPDVLLKVLWYVLVGSWAIGAALRFLLVYYSWPRDRWVRLFFGVVHVAFSAYFLYRVIKTADTLPEPAGQYEIVRAWLNLALITASILDAFYALSGLAKARAVADKGGF